MGKLIKAVLAAAMVVCLGVALTGCGSNASDSESNADVVSTDTGKHVIGVAVYNVTDSEVIMFNKYLNEYVAGQAFDDVQFIYSESLGSSEDVSNFIDEMDELGAEGIMSFYTLDLKAEVEACAERGMYYEVASGTVSDEAFETVADNPYFLGAFGPGTNLEYQAGADMAKNFAERDAKDKPSAYAILSGGAGASLGSNEMHLQRACGMIEQLETSYGVTFDTDAKAMATVDEATTFTAGDLQVTVCPGYGAIEEQRANVVAALDEADPDYVMACYTVASIIDEVSSNNATLGVIDCYSQENQLLFSKGKLSYVSGKYGSLVGPAFVAMYNAVTGHADAMRENGKAVKVVQGFWSSDTEQDYEEKYALASNVTVTAYNYEDLQFVCLEYNPQATLSDLVALAGAYSFEDAQARRAER